MEPLRLKWDRTWPDRPKDYSCKADDGQPVGRVYFVLGSTNSPEHWYWTCNGRYRGRLLSTSGEAKNQHEAARKVEAEWFAAIAQIDDGLNPPAKPGPSGS